MASSDAIVIRGASEHNLKDLDVVLPRNRLIVITGLSGSGKSTLAFDTLFAEGQRRYVESLSAYARQFLGQMRKPQVRSIEGLSPAISIDQKTVSKNPRSTVGTVTEVYDHLRLLYARVGVPHCPSCGRVVSRQTVQEIVDRVWAESSGPFQVLAPLIVDQKVWRPKAMEDLRRRGLLRVRIDGEVHRTDEDVPLDRFRMHTIEAVVDRIDPTRDEKQRVTEAIEQALGLSSGLVRIVREGGQEALYSEHFACPACGVSFEELQPRNFSFNSPHGACPRCAGLGSLREVDPSLLIPDGEKSLAGGAIAGGFGAASGYILQQLEAVGRVYGFDIRTPWQELGEEARRVVLYGSGDRAIPMRLEGRSMSHDLYRPFEGLIPNLQRRYIETQSRAVREEIESLMSMTLCPACKGTRLKPESAAVTVGGKTLPEVTSMSVTEALAFFNRLELPRREALVAKEIVKEILSRLSFLRDVGLGYLTLDRPSSTLSGGEGQRIRLATQIGSRLVGVLYILDEPSIGLHQRDNARLIATLKELRDLGNTVIVVEHDEETIRAADHIVDLGPGAGVHGGYLVAEGTPEAVAKNPASLTGRYLAGDSSIPVPATRRPGSGRALVVRNAREHNLKGIDVRIPLNAFTCVTGVSGSGKSTLVHDILYAALARHFYGSTCHVGAHDGIDGIEHIDKVIIIDQSPIGRTPRSNPATYTGVFDPIRKVFAATKDAKVRGYKAGRFSFNVRGGRCEKCEGAGLVRIEMHFLPDLYIPCDLCRGQRYNRETLEVRFKGKNIREVLDMTVEEALAFFAHHGAIRSKLQTLVDVGLGYVPLGQSATTLSGGEAQRVKLAKELSKRATGRTLYLLDEPTTGLHFEDIRRLLDVLSRLTDAGNTVLVIEHNLDVIKTADHIIDLGPEGGDEGGYVVATGTPEEVARTDCPTGLVLRRVLGRPRAGRNPLEKTGGQAGTEGQSASQPREGSGRRRGRPPRRGRTRPI